MLVASLIVLAGLLSWLGYEWYLAKAAKTSIAGRKKDQRRDIRTKKE
jgi:uncharacterized protein YdgA (DUF945 family)